MKGGYSIYSWIQSWCSNVKESTDSQIYQKDMIIYKSNVSNTLTGPTPGTEGVVFTIKSHLTLAPLCTSVEFL